MNTFRSHDTYMYTICTFIFKTLFPLASKCTKKQTKYYIRNKQKVVKNYKLWPLFQINQSQLIDYASRQCFSHVG